MCSDRVGEIVSIHGFRWLQVICLVAGAAVIWLTQDDQRHPARWA